LIHFNCPQCGHGLGVKDEMAGKQGRCPACREAVQVPNTLPRLESVIVPTLQGSNHDSANGAIQAAIERFEVPSDYPHFLFCLPLYYVAKSDGSISFKEAFSMTWNALMSGLVRQAKAEKNAYVKFANNQILKFQGKSNLGDFDILANAICALLSQYPPHEAEQIRNRIRDTCTKVAQASGPMFREKILPEERQMLDKIFSSV